MIADIGKEFPEFKIRLATGAIVLQQSVNDTVDLYQWYILAALNAVILLTCSLAYGSILAGILLLIPVNPLQYDAWLYNGFDGYWAGC